MPRPGVTMPNEHFRDLAREEFAFLTIAFGMRASAWDVGPATTHVEYRGARLIVRLSYQPFGPPWCDISNNKGQGEGQPPHYRLPVTADDPTATELATTPGWNFDAELMKRHRQAISEWLSA